MPLDKKIKLMYNACKIKKQEKKNEQARAKENVKRDDKKHQKVTVYRKSNEATQRSNECGTIITKIIQGTG